MCLNRATSIDRTANGLPSKFAADLDKLTTLSDTLNRGAFMLGGSQADALVGGTANDASQSTWRIAA